VRVHAALRVVVKFQVARAGLSHPKESIEAGVKSGSRDFMDGASHGSYYMLYVGERNSARVLINCSLPSLDPTAAIMQLHFSSSIATQGKDYSSSVIDFSSGVIQIHIFRQMPAASMSQRKIPVR
jgi:hypothetical protein